MTNAPTRKQLCDAVWDRPGVMWPMHVAGWLDQQHWLVLNPSPRTATPCLFRDEPNMLFAYRGKCVNPRKPRARYAKRKRNK